MIEILQTEESTYSTMQQIQEFERKPVQLVNYVSYDSRSKKSKKPSNEQNSSSSSPTGPKKRKCFRCGEPYSRKHLEECRAKNVTCDGCGIKGHFKKCCKKSGNFPKDNSNRENQSSSTGKMNYAAVAPPEADYFNERGIYKEYRPPQIGNMNILRKVQNPSNAIILSEDGVEIQNDTSTSTSDPAPVAVPTPDFPFTEFPSMEVVIQSQIDFPSIFRYIASERKQQFFEQSHQRHGFSTENRAKQSLLRRNERNQRSERISKAFTIYKRFIHYFYFR